MTFPPSAYLLLTREPSQYLLFCLASKLIQTSWNFSWCNPNNICERIMYHGSISNETWFPLASDLRWGFIWVKVQRTSDQRIETMFTHELWTWAGSHGETQRQSWESSHFVWDCKNSCKQIHKKSVRIELIQSADNSDLMVDVETIRHSGNYEHIGRSSLCHHSLCGRNNTARWPNKTTACSRPALCQMESDWPSYSP